MLSFSLFAAFHFLRLASHMWYVCVFACVWAIVLLFINLFCVKFLYSIDSIHEFLILKTQKESHIRRERKMEENERINIV